MESNWNSLPNAPSLDAYNAKHWSSLSADAETNTLDELAAGQVSYPARALSSANSGKARAMLPKMSTPIGCEFGWQRVQKVLSKVHWDITFKLND